MNMFKKGFTVVLSVALSATLVLPSYSAYAETGSIPTEQEKEQANQKVTGNGDIVQSDNKNADYNVSNENEIVSIPHSSSSPNEIKGKTDVQNEEETQINQIADDFQFIFEVASIQENGKYILDTNKATERFGQENLPSILAFIKAVNGDLSMRDLVGVPLPVTDEGNGGEIRTLSGWTGCVVDKIIDFTGIGFITGGMKELIEKKLWDKLAVEVIKVVGKNAIKGGVIGLAASLAWFSVRCIGQ
ncbi:hypothetical protein [Paenibacillus larvae]|uniref:hypothetical protein n=1 Tax=Paenibacillus larvae TaxID=1464 RepID=UPI0002481963|nr:hypothetical protein [Paenibacillus larvae]